SGFEASFFNPSVAQQCGTTPPEQCNAVLQALASQYTRALNASANGFANVRANLSAILSQLKAAAPRTPIVIGTYDNEYRTCNVPAAVKLKTMLLVDQYLEGGGSFAGGLNNVIRQVAAANGVPVADVSGMLGPDDWTADCLNPSASGHAK